MGTVKRLGINEGTVIMAKRLFNFFKSDDQIPDIHQKMINVSLLVVVWSSLGYYFAPPDKSAAFLTLMTLASGFLFGKFTNGFNSGGNDDKSTEGSEDYSTTQRSKVTVDKDNRRT